MANSHRAKRLLKGFGERLEAARIVSDYQSAETFANALDIDAPRYRKYERGESMPPIDLLHDISGLTGRDLDWLLKGPTKRSTPPAVPPGSAQGV